MLPLLMMLPVKVGGGEPSTPEAPTSMPTPAKLRAITVPVLVMLLAKIELTETIMPPPEIVPALVILPEKLETPATNMPAPLVPLTRMLPVLAMPPVKVEAPTTIPKPSTPAVMVPLLVMPFMNIETPATSIPSSCAEIVPPRLFTMPPAKVETLST
jgi:hypothetical protein